MIRETTYDEIFDAQRHFRTILDSMSRPGKINHLNSLRLWPPAGLHKGAAYIAFALFNADVSVHADSLGADVVEYVRANTASSVAEVAKADYLIFNGHVDSSVALIEEAKTGILAYPETGASAIIQVGPPPPAGFSSRSKARASRCANRCSSPASMPPSWSH
jgi:alpha-D-ribose 1-methylphosphonate 5-triphosphate synthase subunit PhnH